MLWTEGLVCVCVLQVLAWTPVSFPWDTGVCPWSRPPTSFTRWWTTRTWWSVLLVHSILPAATEAHCPFKNDIRHLNYILEETGLAVYNNSVNQQSCFPHTHNNLHTHIKQHIPPIVPKHTCRLVSGDLWQFKWVILGLHVNRPLLPPLLSYKFPLYSYLNCTMLHVTFSHLADVAQQKLPSPHSHNGTFQYPHKAPNACSVCSCTLCSPFLWLHVVFWPVLCLMALLSFTVLLCSAARLLMSNNCEK